MIADAVWRASDLPPRLGTNFGSDGTPGLTAPLGGYLFVMSLIWLILWALLIAEPLLSDYTVSLRREEQGDAAADQLGRMFDKYGPAIVTAVAYIAFAILFSSTVLTIAANAHKASGLDAHVRFGTWLSVNGWSAVGGAVSGWLIGRLDRRR